MCNKFQVIRPLSVVKLLARFFSVYMYNLLKNNQVV